MFKEGVHQKHRVMEGHTAIKKNLVVITSAIQCHTCSSVFTPERRYLQLMRSILSVLEKVPNPYIVLLDTGTMSDLQKEMVRTYVDELLSINVSRFSKNGGELLMTYMYFGSENFKSILPSLATISKLSGRYFLTERFDFNKFDMTKNLIRFRFQFRENCPPFCDTRYFRLPVERFPAYWEKYEAFFKENMDRVNEYSVENLYYNGQFFVVEDCIWDEQIGVGGFFADGGGYVED